MPVNSKSDIKIGNVITVGNKTYRFITGPEKRKYHDPYSVNPWDVEMYAADAILSVGIVDVVPIYEMRWAIVNNTEDKCCYWPVPSSVWKDLDEFDVATGRRIYHPGKPKYPSLW